MGLKEGVDLSRHYIPASVMVGTLLTVGAIIWQVGEMKTAILREMDSRFGNVDVRLMRVETKMDMHLGESASGPRGSTTAMLLDPGITR